MTQKSVFWTTNDTGDGPAAGYTEADMYNFLRRLLVPEVEDEQGVLRGVGSELAVSGSSSPLAVADGAAIVYGLFYENSASLNLAVTIPVVGVTGGRVNLKADWTAQTVRAVVQLSTDGTPDIPALVQTAGAEWSIPLATFTINQAGTITLTDVRNFCQFANWMNAAMIDAVTGLSVIGRASGSEGAAAAITAGSDGLALIRSGGALLFGQVPTGGIADDAVTADKIADDAVGTDQIADEAVTADKIAADAVDDTKLGARAPQFYRRQGGNAADWSSAGVNNYTPGAVRMQAGTISITIPDTNYYASQGITLPTELSDKPLVFLTVLTPTNNIYSARAEFDFGERVHHRSQPEYFLWHLQYLGFLAGYWAGVINENHRVAVKNTAQSAQSFLGKRKEQRDHG